MRKSQKLKCDISVLWGPWKGSEDCLHLFYENRLRELGLLILEKRRLWGELIVIFQYLNGAYKKEGEGHFTPEDRDMTRWAGFKLKEERLRVAVRREILYCVVRHWTVFPGKLWMPHPWRSSRPGWMQLWATLRVEGSLTMAGGRIRLSVRSLRTQTILRFYDSVTIIS